MNNNYKKNIFLAIFVIFGGLMVAGGTYAWLTNSVSVTNGVHNVSMQCFLIDYNINNVSGGQDITGTMFPSENASGGLNGRVGLKTNSNCQLYGTGTLTFHINTETSTKLTTRANSYCQDRSTLEPISGITTEEDCYDEEVNGRWQGYGDPYCESTTTLARLDYPQSTCASHGGTWVTTNLSPLKYAVYYGSSSNPIVVGRITSNDIGHDIDLKNDIIVTDVEKNYYIYIWLDGYLTDSTYTELPFSGYISASAIQNPDLTSVYTANLQNNPITIGQSIPNGIIKYNTKEEAMAVLAATYGTGFYPFFLKHTILNNVVVESYVGFVTTNYNSGATIGTYYLKGGDGSASYFDNKERIYSILGSNCSSQPSTSGTSYSCQTTGLQVFATEEGQVNANNREGAMCTISSSGSSSCKAENAEIPFDIGD